LKFYDNYLGWDLCSSYLLDAKSEYIDLQFYALGGSIGMVLGAIQSLSCSTYSKLLPETEDHATYFSFFDVTSSNSIWDLHLWFCWRYY
jgi:UMF1 family MFS transporter